MRGLPPTAAVLAVILSATLIQAGVDYQQCCTKAPVPDGLQPLQWSACHATYNESETDPAKMYAPAIKTTYAWCHKNCESSGHFQRSGTNQWLSPLAAWVIPASALLLLLPISEHLKTDEQYYGRTNREKVWGKYVSNWLHPLMEYIQILGDPASAFNGALAQMIADWTLCLSMSNPGNRKRERDLILVVMLVEQANIGVTSVRNALELMAGSDRVREYSRTAGRVMWSARKKFNTSVAMPVALYIGVAAAVFYDAYQKLGDNDISHSLAYGIWYNWILLLAVFANCFASHSNLDAVRSGLEIIIRGTIENHTLADLERAGWDKQAAQPLSESYAIATASLKPYPAPHPPMLLHPTALFSGNLECKGVPLHKRYQNTHEWVRWLHKNGVDLARPTEGIWSHHLLWPNWYSSRCPKTMYLITQLLSWLFVLFSCGCATVISYTTPKTGLGCRSLNHLLYISVAFLVAIIRVAKDSLDDPPNRRKSYYLVSAIYHTLAILNAVLVLIGGSLMQLTGIFRNCLCMANVYGLTPDSEIVLSTNTYVHQYWAKVVWLRVAYLSFGGVAGLSVCGLFVRLYITRTVKGALTGPKFS